MNPQWQGKKYAIIGLVLLSLGVWLDSSGLDLLIADQFYRWQNGQWALREHFITETLLHKAARQMLVLFILSVMTAAVISHWRRSWQHWQRPLWYLFLCLVTTPALVAIGKSLTHMDCPWDIQAFGGQFPYLHLLDKHPASWPYGRCFPGGHSSGGFALVALWFFLSRVRPAWRRAGLYSGLLAGVIFALTQQLRGAHFMSHDVWSLAIAWTVSTLWFYLFFVIRISPQALKQRVSTVLLTAVAALLLVSPAAGLAAGNCQSPPGKHQRNQAAVISDINVIAGNIFDTADPEQDSKIHYLMNGLHIVTQADVIRKKLLFQEGDVYEQAKIDESERLLRASHYLKDAEITAEHLCAGKVAVTVRTQDNWTFTPGLSLGRSGGNSSQGFSVRENNLFGWGKSLGLAYKSDHERDSFRFHYVDDFLLDSRKQLAVDIASNSDGHAYQLDLESPFYERGTARAWQLQLEDVAMETSLYERSEVTEKFSEQRQLVGVSYGWAAASDTDSTRRYRAGWHHEQKNIHSLDDADKRQAVDLSYPWAEYEYLEHSYLELKNLNTMGRTEDIADGKHFTIRGGFLATALGNDANQLKLEAKYSDSFISNNRHLGLFDFQVSTYLGEGPLQGAAAKLESRYHYFIDEKNTVFLRSAFKAADNLLFNEQYLLGDMEDLRGYPQGFQTGNKSATFSAEYRRFFDKSPYQLVKLGAVAFADLGTVWGDGADPDWVSDVGIGLRIVPVRSSSAKVIHADLAFPLDGNGEIDSMQFTIGTKMSF